MARNYEGKVAFIGMAGNDTEPPMRGFVEQYGLAFPQAVSEDGSLWGRFGVPGQPAWVFVDDSGEYEVHVGPYGQAELEARLDELIAN